MRYNLARHSLWLCFLLGGFLPGCKSVATTFHRMHSELTSELIKEDADEDSHYYGAWFIWSRPLIRLQQGRAFRMPAVKQATERCSKVATLRRQGR